jgi:hypothetical protein
MAMHASNHRAPTNLTENWNRYPKVKNLSGNRDMYYQMLFRFDVPSNCGYVYRMLLRVIGCPNLGDLEGATPRDPISNHQNPPYLLASQDIALELPARKDYCEISEPPS